MLLAVEIIIRLISPSFKDILEHSVGWLHSSAKRFLDKMVSSASPSTSSPDKYRTSVKFIIKWKCKGNKKVWSSRALQSWGLGFFLNLLKLFQTFSSSALSSFPCTCFELGIAFYIWFFALLCLWAHPSVFAKANESVRKGAALQHPFISWCWLVLCAHLSTSPNGQVVEGHISGFLADYTCTRALRALNFWTCSVLRHVRLRALLPLSL